MTQPTSLVFPFHFANVEGLGRLFYPIIQLQLRTLWGWQSFDFLVDTGADITTLPSFAFGLFGVQKKDLHRTTTQGVGGIEIDTWATTVPVRIAGEQFRIHAVITEDGNTPLLLGKKDIFDTRFNLFLDSQKQQTVLTRHT